MHHTTNILNTKLMPPRIHDVIQRPGLSSRLPAEMLQKRLTTIIAGAGYGKTTLAAQAVADCGVPAVWYRMDKSDEEFITFLSYLIAGVGKRYPKFQERMSEHIKSPDDFGLNLEFVLTIFINELEAAADTDMIIVLDDYHLVRDSDEIRAALIFLLENLPHLVHLVLISRADIGLPLSRLKAMREILEITEQELVFSPDDVRQLFSRVFDILVKDENIRTLHQKTSGWVSGLILFYHTLRGKTDAEIESLLPGMQGAHQSSFSYLEENVYDRLTRNEREFLLRTSILTKLNAAFCNQFLNIKNAGEILRHFEENHLFTFSLCEDQNEEKESYYYQHLFQDFLRTKLRTELGSDEISALHKTAGQIHESNGEDEAALEHYLVSKKFDSACRILSRVGRKMIKYGQVRRINSILRRFPNHYLKSNPWIQYLHAGSLELAGKLTPAREYYQNAIQGFRAIQYWEGEHNCLNDLAMNYYLFGDFRKSASLFKELLEKKEISYLLKTIVLGKMIEISYCQGRISDSDKYIETALAFLPDIESNYRTAVRIWVDIGIAERYFKAGDFNEALSILERLRDELGNFIQPRLLASCCCLLSKVFYKLGFFEKGIEVANAAIEISDEKGLRDFSYAFPPLSLSANYRGLGRLTEAISSAREGLNRMREMGSLMGQAYAFLELHNAYFAEGNLAAAEDNVRNGLSLLEILELPLIIRGELETALAAIHIEKGESDQAFSLLQDAEKRVWHSKWHKSQISCIYARLYMK